MAFSPIITRIYGPESFGIQGVFLSLAGILAAISALTYPIAIVLPKEDLEAYALAKLSIYVGIGSSIFTALMLWKFGTAILTITNSKAIAAYIYLIPAFMFFAVLSTILNQWLIRKQKFKTTAKISIWQSLGINTLKVGIGTVHPSPGSLVIANTLGSLLQSIPPIFILYCNNTFPRLPTNKKFNLYKLSLKYRDFPLLRAPQVFLSSTSQSFPVIALSSFFGPSAAAFYSLSFMVIGVPSTLIGNAVTQVFYPKFNNIIQSGESGKKLLLQATLYMAAVGAPIFLFLAIASPLLFGIIFGTEWKEAGKHAQWVTLWLYAAFVNRPTISAIPVLKLQGVFLIHEIISIIIRLSSLYAGYIFFGTAASAISAFSVAGLITNTTIILIVLHSSSRSS